MKAPFRDCTCYVVKGKITPESLARCTRHTSNQGPTCEEMTNRLRNTVNFCAEMYANAAFLRSSATVLIEKYGTVEDALLACMVLQAAAAEI